VDTDNKLNNYLKITGIINNMFRPQKTLKKIRIKLCNTLALPALNYGPENWTIQARRARIIAAAEVKYMRKTAGYTWTDCKTNIQIAKELNKNPVLDGMQEYNRKWLQHSNRTPRYRLLRMPQKVQTNMQKKQGEIIKETSRPVRPEQGNKWTSCILVR